MATDVDDEYGDEWGSEQAEDANKEGFGTGDEAVHPLAPLGKLGGYADDDATTIDSHEVERPLHHKEDDWKASAIIKTVSSSVADVEDDAALPVGHGGHGEEELPREPTAAKHTRHYKSGGLIPPSPPSSAKLNEPLAKGEDDKVDSAALYARVAAIRITEYREMAREKEEEVRRREADLAQRRREVRRSNKPIHEAYGVANFTPKERLSLTVRALKKQVKQSERAADLERKSRWYNKQQARRSAAPAHAQQLSSKETHARRKQERLARDAIARVRSNQDHLKQQAKARIAKNTCEYVRGSYLLKVSPSNARVSARTKTDSGRAATSVDATIE